MPYIQPEESVFGVSFFERLSSDAETLSLLDGPEPEKVMQSIKRNVSNILNTRLGDSLSSPYLGLVDFNDASANTLDLSIQIKRSIKVCLEQFEPRLTGVSVEVIHDEFEPLKLRFVINAVINAAAIHELVKIDVLLDNNKKYQVVS